MTEKNVKADSHLISAESLNVKTKAKSSIKESEKCRMLYVYMHNLSPPEIPLDPKRRGTTNERQRTI